MDNFEKFKEEQLPDKSQFKSDLTGQEISDDDYAHAQKVWREFECKTMEDYHNLYVQLDVCLLAEAFERFRSVSMDDFKLDPALYFSLPGLAFDAAFLMGNISVQYIKDPDMYIMLEEGIRGGICSVGLRYASANNPYMNDQFDPTEPTSYISYLDCNGQYSYALRNYLPYDGFCWSSKFEGKSMDWVTQEILKLGDEDDIGFIFKCDLEYSPDLHNLHNCYPCAPEKKIIDESILSPYSLNVKNNLSAPGNTSKQSKLVQTLENKKEYIVHYRALKMYLKLGLKLTKIHSVIQFRQRPIFRKYIDFCIEKRQAAADKFTSDLYKLFGNIIYGKCLEDKRGYVNMKLVLDKERALKFAKKPTLKDVNIINENCVLLTMKKLSVCLDCPIYIGVSVLDDSKALMYDFHFNYMKRKYGEKCNVCYSDTDSLVYHVVTDDFYKDMYEENVSGDKKWFDTSNFSATDPKRGFLHSMVNHKVVGKFKDEYAWTTITEIVALKPKLYAVKTLDADKQGVNVYKRAKGTVKSVVQNQIKFEDYLTVLANGSSKNCTMSTIRSFNQKLHTVDITKRSLSAFDDKAFYISSLQSLKFGHVDIPIFSS